MVVLSLSTLRFFNLAALESILARFPDGRPPIFPMMGGSRSDETLRVVRQDLTSHLHVRNGALWV